MFGLRVVNQLVLGSFKKLPVKSPYVVNMRCWPIDYGYMHMNNSSYLVAAELIRWRAFPQGNMMKVLQGRMPLFIPVEQSVQYFKSIELFQKYVISTTVSEIDSKCVHYNHIFQQHPDDLKSPDQKPTVFCIVSCKSVLTEKSNTTTAPTFNASQTVINHVN
jgi:acyl-CoA thioesterase FadM